MAIVLSLLLMAVLVLPLCAAANPANDYLSIVVGPDGRFNSGATGVVTGSQYRISYAWPSEPWSGFATVRVDGVDTKTPYNDEGSTLVNPPVDVTPTTSVCTWTAGDILVEQRLSLVTGSSTGRPDTGEYTYVLHNNGTTAHEVGLRIMIDTMLAGNDRAPFRIPGTGDVTTEMDFNGVGIPDYWQAFEDLANPNIMAQGTLRGGEATPPDRFSICSWGLVFNSVWDYATTPGMDTGDSATTMWWNPVTVQPGATRTITTYYGLATMSGTPPLTLTGPVQLSSGLSDWSPNPFTITAYLGNEGTADLVNAPVELTLPAGLEFAPGETAIHTIPLITPGQTGQTSWSVRAIQSGQWTYSASALGVTRTRDILVPLLNPPGPAITLEKYISIDGVNWEEADTAPGVLVPYGTDPYFRWVITNSGGVTLSDLTLTDSVFNSSWTPEFAPSFGGPLDAGLQTTVNYGPVPFESLFTDFSGGGGAPTDFVVWGKGVPTGPGNGANLNVAVNIGTNSQVQGNVGSRGDIDTNGHAVIDGNVDTASQLIPNPNHTITGSITQNDAGVSQALPTPATIPAGTFAVPHMANGVSYTFNPGVDYKAVSGGGGCKLYFTAGEYHFDSISFGNGTKLYMDLSGGPIRILVKGQAYFGANADVILTDGGDSTMIYLESQWHGTASKPWGFSAAGGSDWLGTVFTPYSGIHFGSGGGASSFQGYMWSNWDGVDGTSHKPAISIEGGVRIKPHTSVPDTAYHTNTGHVVGTYISTPYEAFDSVHAYSIRP